MKWLDIFKETTTLIIKKNKGRACVHRAFYHLAKDAIKRCTSTMYNKLLYKLKQLSVGLLDKGSFLILFDTFCFKSPRALVCHPFCLFIYEKLQGSRIEEAFQVPWKESDCFSSLCKHPEITYLQSLSFIKRETDSLRHRHLAEMAFISCEMYKQTSRTGFHLKNCGIYIDWNDLVPSSSFASVCNLFIKVLRIPQTFPRAGGRHIACFISVHFSNVLKGSDFP